METVMLKNNLRVLGKEENYYRLANRGMTVYAMLTFIVALTSGMLFNLHPYLPMILGTLIALIGTLFYFSLKDVSPNNQIKMNIKEKPKRLKLSKIIGIILISYAIFYGVVTVGQQNAKLFIQYELTDLYTPTKVSLYLSVIVVFSRFSRLVGNIIFGKIYIYLKNRSLFLLTFLLFISFFPITFRRVLLLFNLVKIYPNDSRLLYYFRSKRSFSFIHSGSNIYHNFTRRTTNSNFLYSVL